MTPIIKTEGSTSIICDPEKAGDTSLPFEVARAKSEGWSCEVAGKGRGEAWFLQRGSNHWVLRHYRRGGLLGKLLSDQYLGVSIERSRAFQEWRLMHQLYSAGLPTAEPVAARVIRHGFYYRADLITKALYGVEPLSQRLIRSGLQAEQWRAVGQLLKRFADFGAYHADLNAHNVLLDDSFNLYLIDWDKGHIDRAGCNQWAPKNLARFKRSLEKISRLESAQYCASDWNHVVAGYKG